MTDATVAVSPLRRRMIDDMSLRNLRQPPQRSYLHAVTKFSRYFGYPASLVVLGLFIAYQLYRYSYTHGLGLIVLTVFDLIVIAFIWHEYRLIRHHLLVK